MSETSQLNCLNCKRKHFRCDKTIPACGNCRRLNRYCSYPPSQGIQRPQSSLSRLVQLPKIPLIPGNDNKSITKAARMPDRRHLVHDARKALDALGPITATGMTRTNPKSSRIRSVLHVGIDFGTTYSSIAFVRKFAAVDPNQPRPVEKAKLGKFSIVQDEGSNELQVPSEIAWDPVSGRLICGSVVDRCVESGDIGESDRIKFIKLGLDTTSKTEGIRRLLNQKVSGLANIGLHGCRIEDLIATFMAYLWKLAEAAIRLKYPGEDPLSWEIETALAVPAIWKRESVEKMIRAAETAGIPRPYVVSEPAAAAHLLIQREQEQNDDTLAGSKHGLQSWIERAFCVVDMGGGTVDLITYAIQSLTPLRMQEEVKGSGGLCGSAYINQTFLEFTERHFEGNENFIKECTRLNMEEFCVMTLREFEKKKRTFNGYSPEQGDTVLTVHGLQPLPALGIRKNQWRLTKQQMTSIMEPTGSRIIGLIHGQVLALHEQDDSRRMMHNALVGGLSCSPHIREMVSIAFCSGPDPPLAGYPIPLMDPLLDSATLISQGAILASLNRAAITSRYLIQSFGVAWDEPYNPNLHGNVPFELDQHYNDRIVRNQCMWILRMGQAVPQVYSGFRRGWRAMWLDEHHDVIAERIFCSDTQNQDHLSVDDPQNDIHQYGYLEMSCADMDFSKFEVRTNPANGRKYHFAEYEIRFNLDGCMLTYECIIPRSGKFSDEESHGQPPFRAEGRMNIGAAFPVGEA